ncbi:MAG: UDP-N-acetylglucosamine 2-epimerase [candidate division BRC1 bacterium ADurb.BinA292]|nr:MAG: UDP-N-acetylglucosamine 2-epimerase [candidate division BRC1 bacterium ADurb.BinA292]
MSVKRIAIVCGTRPEAIKLAPVYLELARRRDRFEPLLWATAQHRQMLDQVLETFGLRADRDFNLMRPGQTLTMITTAVLEALEPALAADQPDLLMVQGDTTTAFAGALAAFYARTAVAHVEAGLRTETKFAPWPEEMNRRLASRLTDFHFPPTERARANLLAENVPADRIWVTGNTVIDALAIVVAQVRARRPEFPPDFPLDRLANGRRMVLITGHRRENFGPGFESLCRAIAELARRNRDIEFIYPVHLNPNVREPVGRILKGIDNVHLTEPLQYQPFVWAMDRCHFLLSDSGGVQEEAPHLGKPVLVMRETTERPEALEAGTSRLVGTDFETILREATRLLEDEAAYLAMSRASNPFGDGRAAVRIAEVLERHLGVLAPR